MMGGGGRVSDPYPNLKNSKSDAEVHTVTLKEMQQKKKMVIIGAYVLATVHWYDMKMRGQQYTFRPERKLF
jgi:hypothetical protein